MKQVKVPSYHVNVWIAGDYATAVSACREYCRHIVACFTVTPCAYVYTGGMEDGVCVRLLNYPRFPSAPEQLLARAKQLAEHLRDKLCQWSYTLEAPDVTIWMSNRPEDNK